MHSDIAELLQRIAYVVVRVSTVSRYAATVAASVQPCTVEPFRTSLRVLSMAGKRQKLQQFFWLLWTVVAAD